MLLRFLHHFCIRVLCFFNRSEPISQGRDEFRVQSSSEFREERGEDTKTAHYQSVSLYCY